MSSPLITNLTEVHGLPVVDECNVEDFLSHQKHSLLFFTEDPARYPESNDVAVILPEILKAFGNRLSAAVVHRDAEKALQARYGFNAWPALVLLRGDAYLGAITRVQDWALYLSELEDLLAVEPSRPPSIGIAVVEEQSPACH